VLREQFIFQPKKKRTIYFQEADKVGILYSQIKLLLNCASMKLYKEQNNLNFIHPSNFVRILSVPSSISLSLFSWLWHWSFVCGM